MCLHQNLEEDVTRAQDHVTKESIACRSEPADLDAETRIGFPQIVLTNNNEGYVGARTKHAGLYKKGKIRVQVILNWECFLYGQKL